MRFSSIGGYANMKTTTITTTSIDTHQGSNEEDDNDENDAEYPSEQQREETAEDVNHHHQNCLSDPPHGPIIDDNNNHEFDWMQDPYAGTPGSKYSRYQLPVEHEEGDRAMKIQLCSFKRPHMRALHCAWFSFFCAFSIWFAPAPLLTEIADTLNLTKKQIWNSSIANDIMAIILRILIGPVCDAYGPRIPMAVVLVVASIPTFMVGLVQTATGLVVIRLFIGIAGCSFVMAQFWPSRMFSREIAGTANGIVGGWGNFGGAFAQLFMGSILFPIFRDYVYDGNAEKAWRIICIFPATMALLCGMVLPFISDDAPCGNYSKMTKTGTMDQILFTTSLRSGAKRNTWILYVQYACCFGVEIVMNNASVLYFTSEYGLNTEMASFLGFAFGSLNLFARGVGGWCSDKLNMNHGMRGRLWLVTILLILQGVTIIVFSFCRTLVSSIAMMCIFSLFVQSVEGAIFGIIPYVSKLYTGSVAGFVGAGGNVGSVVFALGFRSLDYNTAFLLMGALVMASSILSVFIDIPCHACLLWGKDNNAVITARLRFKERRMLENQDACTLNTIPCSNADVEMTAVSAPASTTSHDTLVVKDPSPSRHDGQS